MAKPSRSSTQANMAVPTAEQQRIIAEKTAAFLAGGGEIQRIPKGVSGYTKLGGPQIPVASQARAARTT